MKTTYGNFQEVMARCASDERCRRVIRPPPGYDNNEAAAEEVCANNTRTRYNVGLLRNKDTRTAFQISLSNRFQLLQELTEGRETDIETQ